MTGEKPTSRQVTEESSVAGIVKAVICRIIVALPCRYWATAAALVRRIWSGFRHA